MSTKASLKKRGKNRTTRNARKLSKKTIRQLQALRSALGAIEERLGLGHLRTD